MRADPFRPLSRLCYHPCARFRWPPPHPQAPTAHPTPSLLCCTPLRRSSARRHVKRVVDELGGIQRIFLRYFEHYELTTPLTLLEVGWGRGCHCQSTRHAYFQACQHLPALHRHWAL